MPTSLIHLLMETYLHLCCHPEIHPFADSSRSLARYVLSGKPLVSVASLVVSRKRATLHIGRSHLSRTVSRNGVRVDD